MLNKTKLIVLVSLLVVSSVIVVLLFNWPRIGQVVAPTVAQAQEHHTYYMCASGCDFANLQQAFTGPNKMSGGDTLIIRDGTYTGSDNLMSRYIFPPSGSESNYTIIKAEHDGEVSFTDGAGMIFDYYPYPSGNPICYVEFRGFNLYGEIFNYGLHHVKFFHCAFEGDMGDGNTITFSLHTCHHILVEDCIAYGKGRYKFMAYQSSEIIFRRCVARMDYANGNWNPSSGDEPIAVYAMYYATNVEVQNCISIDGDMPQFWQNPPEELDGSFLSPVAAWNVKWRGCIGLNVAMEGSAASGNGENVTFDNCIIWHHMSGLESKPSPGDSVSHATIGDLKTYSAMGLTLAQYNKSPSPHGMGIYSHEGGFPITNSIVTGAFSKAIGTSSLGKNVLWNNGSNGNTIASDITNVNPFTNSLKYLPRIEAGSTLSGAASDSGDIGATIIKRIGVSGTLYGDPGYNQVTNENLWPWPYEDWIKEEMGNYNRGGVDPNLPRGDRGFTAYVSPFGSPNTLTSYIWEYLGNKIPCEVYNTCSQPEPQTCAQLGGSCCSTGQICSGGSSQTSSNCGFLCCVSGVCQTPVPDCPQAGGTCQTNACDTYNTCSSLIGTCASGYCCSGSCADKPVLTPNITLTKTVDKTQASQGEEIIYTITYANTGTGGATDVVITDSIPTGTAYVAGSASNSGTLSGATLTWTIASVASGGSGTVSFRVKVD